MKKQIIAVLISGVLVLASCSQETITEDRQVKENSFQKGHEVARMLDGDLSTGWIAEKRIEANGSEVVEIDLGESKTISEITIDDTFTEGHTNEMNPYEPVDVLVADWDCSTWEGNDTPERLFDGMVGRKGWSADIIPTIDEPIYMLVQLSQTQAIGKVEINNQGYGSIPKSFEIQTSMDGESYTTIYKNETNDKDKLIFLLDEVVECNYIKYVVYDQSGQTVTLDEMILFSKDDHKVFDHFPRKFSILVATEDSEYEVIAMENANTESVWTITFEPREVRYIKYVAMEELGDNKPSIGELIIE